MHRLLNYLSFGEDEISNDDFERIEKIGKGGFGNVLLVRKEGGRDDGQVYAMKIIKKTNLSNKINSYARLERAILEDVKGVPFLGQLHYAFHTQTNLYLVMEYLNGGDLTRIKLSVTAARFYIGEVVLALENLHKMGIAHRDVKPANVMIDQDGHVVLIDFGGSWKFNDIHETVKCKSRVGTTPYLAPEIAKREPHGLPVDWWSVGIMTHTLIMRKYPFIGIDNAETLSKIMNCNPRIDPELPAPAARFVEQLLEKDPRKRLGCRGGGANELKAHEFFKGMDWDRLANKGYPPPRKPTVLHELDTTNFNKFGELDEEDPSSNEPSMIEIYKEYPYPAATRNYGPTIAISLAGIAFSVLFMTPILNT